MSDSEPELPGSVYLRHQGEEIAEAWGEQEGEVVTLVFRVPRDRWEADAAGPRVTIDLLLKLSFVSDDEVESWQVEGDSRPGASGPDLPPDTTGAVTGCGVCPVGQAFLPAPQAAGQAGMPAPLQFNTAADATHITVRVRLKPQGRGTADIPPGKWQALEVIWKTILGLEGSIEASRLSMDGLRSEMETAFKKTLAVEDKLNALQSDVAQWDKAKNRVHFALPKVKEFIHRATFALAAADRKALEEIYRNHIEPRVPLPDADQVRAQLEHLQKSRQVLFAQGNSVAQECRAIMGEISRALSTLQRNASDRARQKRSDKRQKGKHF